MDGTVAAYRLPYLLAGNSVVLKQDSPYYEHYYSDLRAFEHFVPFHRDPKLDLVEKVQWLKSNDQEAQKIMKNARKFARENLMPANIFCYYLLLLKVSSFVIYLVRLERLEKVETQLRIFLNSTEFF